MDSVSLNDPVLATTRGRCVALAGALIAAGAGAAFVAPQVVGPATLTIAL